MDIKMCVRMCMDIKVCVYCVCMDICASVSSCLLFVYGVYGWNVHVSTSVCVCSYLCVLLLFKPVCVLLFVCSPCLCVNLFVCAD